jgi:FAD/FMN-containing dehydrogenase/Fe-S oxidoreductase
MPLQRLKCSTESQPVVALFLQRLRQDGFEGEIHLDDSTRLVNSTDNSVYQILPLAVLSPRVERDIVRIFKLADQSAFQSLTFAPRGGGTGTNGQSLNASIIIDCSRFLNQIIELNLDEQWVRVQPGVVLDQLNRYLKPHGVFFAPTVSPSNRATIGGMANTDASGKGSLLYGKTSQHVIAIQAVYTDGSVHKSHKIDATELAKLKAREDRVGRIYRQVDETVCTHHDTIVQQFPKLKRFMTGYNLAHVLNQEAKEPFNLNAILTGSEGTLVVMTELTLKLTPIPTFKSLFVLQYSDFYDALRDAQFLVNTEPHAIETIDSSVLDLVKTDVIYPFVSQFIETAGKDTQAINLLEFTEYDQATLAKKMASLKKSWKKSPPIAFGFTQVSAPDDMEQLWGLRKKCVGLLGKSPGRRKPVSGFEDTVVPPEKLVDYVTEFRSLLDKAGLQYGMFGHIDVGCLHVRPALDLTNPQDEVLYYQLSTAVAALTKKYGGLMWGEHGKGFRSETVPLFFGEILYPELRKIKQAFDPKNQMNPGKITTPIDLDAKVVIFNAPKRGDFDRDIHLELAAPYTHALQCNGNAACFNYNELDTMCPSYKATHDRRQSPKGRASLLREWLRLWSIQPQGRYTPRWLNSLLKRCHQTDFSHEVHAALQGCLGCKACVTQCPVNVDIPSMKAQFLEAYHSRYLRPLRDYVIAYSERLSHLSARFHPALANRFLHQPLMRWGARQLGLVDLPRLSVPSLQKLCETHQVPILQVQDVSKLTPSKNIVILVQDWLTSCYDAPLVMAYYQVLTRCGYQVYLLETLEQGKTWHALGFLKRFNAIAEKTTAQLARVAQLGYPMIGLEPSLTLSYRDEYPDMPFRIHLIEEWLSTQPLPQWTAEKQTLKLFLHCSEKVHDSTDSKQWALIFSQLGFELQIVHVGCCGMAGNYGMELEHQVTSRQLFELGWRQALQEDVCLATGFSCRSQIARLAAMNVRHPIDFLSKWYEKISI